MYYHRIAAASLMALGIAASATVARAEHGVDIQIGVAPPEARYEAVPAPREGYIYDRGHYEWDRDGNRYVWRDGRYIEKREGHEWHPSVIERDGDRWHYRSGHWDDDG